MEILKERYSITELSQCLKVTDHALRYYEKEFNIYVPKDNRGRRYYTTELANIMYQITQMRSEGLEIKAIRKILQAEDTIQEPPPVFKEDGTVSLIPAEKKALSPEMNLKHFFEEFKGELSECVSLEMSSAKEHFSREMTRTKLELGACVENSARKLEAKLDRHFQEVDRCLTSWRDKNRGSFLKRLLKK